ncbi:plasminogen receptor (KT) [Agrilus planipennis]|uniref:Plasminogen receptor (KT) n=1 Tax=Agrilus planipennis TaxID=224129 RepID=A0A1W4WKC8_AGRPL|nr:plasminogen receptor (KT) [Agrilus planipennis]
MGNYFTVNMEENFKRNHEFITEMNSIKLERQLQMRQQLKEREVALEIAASRELFFWYGAFYVTSLFLLSAAYKRNKKIGLLSPIVPLSFIMAYQTDLAYGTKRNRIKAEAEHIMQFEKDLLEPPLGVPSVASIDIAREQNEEKRLLHPVIPTL